MLHLLETFTGAVTPTENIEAESSRWNLGVLGPVDRKGWLREHQGAASRPWKNARHTLGTFYEERGPPCQSFGNGNEGAQCVPDGKGDPWMAGVSAPSGNAVRGMRDAKRGNSTSGEWRDDLANDLKTKDGPHSS